MWSDLQMGDVCPPARDAYKRSSFQSALTPPSPLLYFRISIRKYNLRLAQLTMAQIGTQQWLISSLCLFCRGTSAPSRTAALCPRPGSDERTVAFSMRALASHHQMHQTE